MELSPEGLEVLRSIVFAGALESPSELVAHQSVRLNAILSDLARRGLIESGDLVVPTEEGARVLSEWFARDGSDLSDVERDTIVDRFRPLDIEIKRLSVGWQNAEQSDDWDARMAIIEALTELHESALHFIADHVQRLPRWTPFGDRLQRAIDAVLDGQTDYIVSVRAPSYHTIWCEFHEDLLRTLERHRGPE
jgi:hypothetical protein